MLHILAVQPGLHRDLQLIPAVHLGPAGQARGHIVGPVFVPLLNQVVLVPQRGPGAHHAHLPHKDVPQLGQLIQAGFPQEVPALGDEGVGVLQHMGGHIVGSIRAHGAELQNVEQHLVFAHPLLPEQHRAGRIQLDPQGDHPHGNAQHHQRCTREQNIQQAFDPFAIHHRVAPFTHNLGTAGCVSRRLGFLLSTLYTFGAGIVHKPLPPAALPVRPLCILHKESGAFLTHPPNPQDSTPFFRKRRLSSRYLLRDML